MRAPGPLALLCGLIAALVLVPAARAVGPERVVTLGGAVTEIAFALGAGARLVARDSTSTFPPEAATLPDVGYLRALSPEGILSVAPDLVIATGEAGPPNTLAALRGSGVAFAEVGEARSRQDLLDRITRVGAALGRAPEAAALAARVAADLDAATDAAARAANGRPARVLFVLSAANGRLMAAGQDTAAEAVIALAGGVNALAGFTGYKPVSDEAVIRAAPDAILLMDRGGNHAIADDALVALPAIAATPAGQNRRILRMDGLALLGFGPRTPAAVAALARALYGSPE